MERELEDTPVDGTAAEKILAYNRANRKVAVLCNHQKAVGKGHAASMEKLEDKVSHSILPIIHLSNWSTDDFPARSISNINGCRSWPSNINA